MGLFPKKHDFWHFSRTEEEIVTVGYLDKIKKTIKRLRSIHLFIKNTKPDYLVVSAQGAIILAILLRLVGFIKVPVIAYIHEARNDGGKFYRFLTALIYPFADKLVAVSKGIQKEVQSIWFMDSSKVHLVYNSLPTLVFDENVEDNIKNEIRKYKSPLYCTAGRLEITKGSDVLISSFIEFAKTNNGTLLVLGTGSLKESLEDEVARSQMERRIIFLGKVESVPLYIKQCDAYLSMARSEPFGLAIIESLSMGTPVIATDVPSGPREILSPGAEVSTYPFRGQYGVLLAPPSVLNAGTALKDGVSLLEKIPYDKSALQKRASEFSPLSQRNSFIEVLK